MSTTSTVDIWLVSLSETLLAEPALIRYVSPDEKLRAAQLAQPALERSFLARRGVRRAILGSYLGVPPDNLEFTSTETGRPSVVGNRRLSFSQSVSADFTALAVSENLDVGLDIEVDRPRGAVDSAWQTIRSDERLEALARSVESEDFLQAWCRLEASLKCLGVGFVRPPVEPYPVVFDVATRGAVRAALATSPTPPGFVRMHGYAEQLIPIPTLAEVP